MPDGCCVGCGVGSACHRVADNAPTVLPLAQRASHFPSAPLANRQIAFGCGRVAGRSSARRPLGCGRVVRHGWHGRAALRCGVSLRHRASASLPAHGIHPPIRRGALGRDASRRVRARLGRRLPRTGGGLRSGPARRRPSTCALFAPPVLCAAQASPLAPLACATAVCSAHSWRGSTSCPRNTPPAVLLRCGAGRQCGGVRRSERRRRGVAGAAGADAGATGGIPTKRAAPSPADAWRALRRRRER